MNPTDTTNPTDPTRVHDLLDHRAARTPDAVALVRGTVTWTYRDLQRRSVAAADRLQDLGVGAGDRVLVLAGHEPEVAAVVHAASRLGAIYVVVSDQTRPFHLRHILGDCEPTVVLAAADALATARELGAAGVEPLDALPVEATGSARRPGTDADADDIVSLIYTSGSTSMPKAVVSTHRQVLFAADAIGHEVDYRGDDVVFCCLPLSFDYGLYQLFLACAAGATLVLGDDADAGPPLLDVLIRHDVSVLPLVPSLASTLVRLLRRSERRPERLRLVTNTGAALSVTSAQQLRELLPGLDVVAMFGLTECKRVSIAPPNVDLERPGSVGRPLPGTSVTVVDDQGTEVPVGEPGELVVRGPHVMSGYWRAPEMTALRFRTDASGAPVLHTGDRCRVDEDGHLYFVGRSDDLYKQQGYRVSAVEVEAAALDVDGVDAAAVLPPDEEWDARLVVAGTTDPTTLTAELGHRLEAQKVPPTCLVVETLPLTVNGKLDKKALAAGLAPASGPVGTATR